jgi:long-chain acyl-CoA synthetase
MRDKNSANGGITTLVELFRRSMRREKADQLNYKTGGRWHPVSTREIEVKVRQLAMGLDALGVGLESRVGLLSENRVEWIYADLAAMNIGVADVPIYPTHAPRQVGYILKDAGVEVLFISTREQFERIREVLEECPGVRTLIFFDAVAQLAELAGGRWRVLTLDEFQEMGRAADEAQPARYEMLRERVEPETVATLIYTSGTTGDPKGVVLTHCNLAVNALENCRLGGVYENEVSYSFLPFSHIFERNLIYIYLHAGASMHLATSVETVGAELAEVRPGFMTSVPRLYEKIYARALEKADEGGRLLALIAGWSMGVAREVAWAENRGEQPGVWLRLKHRIADRLVLSKWRAAMGGRIRAMASGGAALAPDLAAVFAGARLYIYQGYGLTETSPSISTNYPGCNRLGSVGRPIADVEVRIAADGEILCSGPNVMVGYYNKPAETAEVLTTDAAGRVWFHTGDIGHLDADGFLYITDRKKDLLKTSGGKYIAPQPIENAIKGSRYVGQVVVIGDGRKFPAAIIIPNFETLKVPAAEMGLTGRTRAELIREPQIIALFERELAEQTADFSQYEKVKAILLLDRELTVEGGELTPTLKVRRKIVNERLLAQIDQLYIDQAAKYGHS